MARDNVLVRRKYIKDTANAIRRRAGRQDNFKPSEFADAILAIDRGGMKDITVVRNGQYMPPANVSGFNKVIVNVPQSSAVLFPKTITQRGTYTASDYNADGFSSVTVDTYPEPSGTKVISVNGTNIDVKAYDKADVNVPNSYSLADEGKVVSNGELVAQTSTTKTANGTYDTTENNEVVVNVPQPSGNINITDMQSTDVSAYATAQVVDADLVAGNIKKDVDILGVVGTYEGSGGATLISKSITLNGMYDAEDDNADGYSDVTVNVPNSYSAADEGKVVSSGALVAQGSQTITQNGTYDTTLISELIANIEGGRGGGVDLSQYDVLKDVSWEQGTVSGTAGKTWEQNKTSSTTRIRMTETTTIEPSHTFYVEINDGYDASVHQYNSSGKYSSSSGWGGYDNKGIVINQPNLGIVIRKTNDTTITPSEISDVGLVVYDITALIEDGGEGGIQTGTTAPTSDVGSDGDYYKQIFPLPSNVNFVEYLQSSGTQYIDTGLYGNGKTGFLYDMEISIEAWGFGARQSGSSRAIIITSNGTSTTSETVGFGSQLNNYSNLSARRKFKMIDGSLYVDDVLVRRHNIETFETPLTLLLFGANCNDKSPKVQITSGGYKLYRAVIYDGFVPIADYLPCLDGNGVACMWDNIAQEYVYNDGTGDFAYGSAATPDELEPVLWVKENGAWRIVGS